MPRHLFFNRDSFCITSLLSRQCSASVTGVLTAFVKGWVLYRGRARSHHPSCLPTAALWSLSVSWATTALAGTWCCVKSTFPSDSSRWVPFIDMYTSILFDGVGSFCIRVHKGMLNNVFPFRTADIKSI